MDIYKYDWDINEDDINGLILALSGTHSTKGLIVDSLGGTFEHFSIHGPKIARLNLTTIAASVQSAAVILYLLGLRRWAFVQSTFFFHEVRTLVEPGIGITIADVETIEEYEYAMARGELEIYLQWKSAMETSQRWFVNFLYRQTGIPVGTFLNLMRAEATLTAYEAHQYGIVQKIVSVDQLYSD